MTVFWFGMLWAAGNALLIKPLFAKHVRRSQITELQTRLAVLVLTPALVVVQLQLVADVGWHGLILTPMVLLGLVLAGLLWRGASILGRS